MHPYINEWFAAHDGPFTYNCTRALAFSGVTVEDDMLLVHSYAPDEGDGSDRHITCEGDGSDRHITCESCSESLDLTYDVQIIWP